MSGGLATVFAMRDSEVVAAIAAGDPAGLAEAYDRYAGPLFSFCRGILREPADAADVVQDTFVIAVPRMSSLRDPERLRSWLYTVARNECLRKLRGLSLEARLEEVPEVTDEAADVAADMEQAELRALVREALPGLGPAEQEVLGLQLRHGLASGEVASVLGVSRNHAHALMSRARVQLEAALGVLVVARSGRRDCPELDAMLGGWDGRLTVLLRKRVHRHLERCATCARRRDRELTPSMLLGVAPVLALPLTAGLAGGLPGGLRDQVMQAVFGRSPAAVAHRAGAGQTPYSFGHHGFPQALHPLQTPWWQAGSVHVGAAAGTATAAAVAAVAGVTLVVVPHHHPAGHHPGGGASVVAGRTASAGAGILAPATHRPPAAGTPTASVAATLSPGATASATPGEVTPGSSPGEVTASDSAPASASASAAASESTDDPAAGTLSVSPGSLDLTSPGSGSVTLTAAGGPVSWSVSVPAAGTKKDDVTVTPTSGTLEDGQSIVVTVTADSATKPKVKLTFSPGGEIVKVVVS